MRCPLSRAAALACASTAISDTDDDERSSFIVTGACGRLSNAAAWVCASAGFGDTAVCESASAAVVAKIAGIRNKRNFMGVLVAGKGMDVSSRVRCCLAGRDEVVAMLVPRTFERENAGIAVFRHAARNGLRLGFEMLRLTARCCGEVSNQSQNGARDCD